MKTRFDSYCGLYCGACPILVANVKGEVEKKAEEWEMDAEDLACRGCKGQVTAGICADCVMRLCARDRGFDFCVECDDYPCGTFAAFQRDRFPHHTLTSVNLKVIADLGPDAWLDEQKKRWSCPSCGEPFTWYEEECSKCGAELYDACAEEDDWANDDARTDDGEALYWKMRAKFKRLK